LLATDKRGLLTKLSTDISSSALQAPRSTLTQNI
jgi:hypothetical protein